MLGRLKKLLTLKKATPEEILHRLLPKLLAKKAPNSIPLTGESAQKNDGYLIYFANEFMVVGYDPNTRILDVRRPDATGAFVVDEEMPLSDALQHPLSISHYYKNYWEEYTNSHSLLWAHTFRLFKIEVWGRIMWNNVAQWHFNKRPLWVIRDNMVLLEYIIERHLGPDREIANTHYDPFEHKFSAFSLMSELRTTRWIHHPNSQRTLNRLNLLLDAFAESGDLVRKDIYYTVTPKAINTLAGYQENKRRHLDSVRIQFAIAVFTFIIALSAVLGACSVKFAPEQRPTLQET